MPVVEREEEEEVSVWLVASFLVVVVVREVGMVVACSNVMRARRCAMTF